MDGDSDRRRRPHVVAWGLVVVWAGVIFYASAKTGADFNSGNGIIAACAKWLAGVLSDALGGPVDPSPVGHFAEYLVFGALLANALLCTARVRDGQPGWLSRPVALSVGIAAAYALTDELHQLFVPGRSCDPVDWAVDVCAALLGALLVHLIARRRG